MLDHSMLGGQSPGQYGKPHRYRGVHSAFRLLAWALERRPDDPRMEIVDSDGVDYAVEAVPFARHVDEFLEHEHEWRGLGRYVTNAGGGTERW